MSRRAVGCRCLILVADPRRAGVARPAGPGRRGPADDHAGSSRSSRTTACTTSRAGLHHRSSAPTPPCRPSSRSSLDYEEGRTLIDEASRSNDLVLREELLQGRQGEARGVRQGASPAPRGPRGPGAARQAAGRARLPGDAPGRGHPGQDEEGRQGRRGPGRLQPGPRGLRQGRRGARRGPGQVPRLDARERPAAGGPRRRRRLLPRRRCSRRASATTSWPRPIRPLPRADEVPRRRPQAVRGPVQGPPRAVGRAGRPDVAGQVLRGEGRDRRRPSACTSSSWSTPTPGSACLQRNVGYFYIVALAKRKEYALAADQATRLAPDLQPPRGAASPRRAWACCSSWPRPSTPRCRRSSQADQPPGRQADHRRPQPGRPLRLAVQERGPRPAQEIQAQRRDEGRGDRPAHLPGRHGEGRRGDRLARVGPRHRPAEGGRPQGRHRPRARQGQPGPVQPGLLLLHEQAVSTRRSSWPSTWPGATRRAGCRPRRPRSPCRRWSTPTTRTPRSTG